LGMNPRWNRSTFPSTMYLLGLMITTFRDDRLQFDMIHLLLCTKPRRREKQTTMSKGAT
jgi:hypothetical protein